MGGTGTGGAGLDDDDDDDEVAGGHGGVKADEEAKIFKRHTFGGDRTRFPLPSMAAHARSIARGHPPPRDRDAAGHGHATAVFHQPRELAAAYAGPSRVGGDLGPRAARRGASRAASRRRSAPPPTAEPPKPPSPERYDPLDEGPDATGAPSGSQRCGSRGGRVRRRRRRVARDPRRGCAAPRAAGPTPVANRGTSAASAPTPVAVDPAHTLAAVAAAAGRRARRGGARGGDVAAAIRRRRRRRGEKMGRAGRDAGRPRRRAGAGLGVGPNAALVDIVRGTARGSRGTCRPQGRCARERRGAEAAAAIVRRLLFFAGRPPWEENKYSVSGGGGASRPAGGRSDAGGSPRGDPPSEWGVSFLIFRALRRSRRHSRSSSVSFSARARGARDGFAVHRDAVVEPRPLLLGRETTSPSNVTRP